MCLSPYLTPSCLSLCVPLMVQSQNPSIPRSVSPAGLLTALSFKETITVDGRGGDRTTAWYRSSLADSTDCNRWSREQPIDLTLPHAVCHHAVLCFYHSPVHHIEFCGSFKFTARCATMCVSMNSDSSFLDVLGCF